MHAIRSNAVRQFWIGGDEQSQAPRPANRSKPAPDAGSITRAEMAINNGRAARQAPRDPDWIGRAFGISQEKQRWRARFAGLAVEAARERG
jgi:hypothetical protein